jgi:hypothetical protein
LSKAGVTTDKGEIMNVIMKTVLVMVAIVAVDAVVAAVLMVVI